MTPTPVQGTEPLTENILATTIPDNSLPLDSSVATLPPIGLAGDQATPPLETLTETFSTTQLVLKTHILPVVKAGSNTTRQEKYFLFLIKILRLIFKTKGLKYKS